MGVLGVCVCVCVCVCSGVRCSPRAIGAVVPLRGRGSLVFLQNWKPPSRANFGLLRASPEVFSGCLKMCPGCVVLMVSVSFLRLGFGGKVAAQAGFGDKALAEKALSGQAQKAAELDSQCGPCVELALLFGLDCSLSPPSSVGRAQGP